jgi:predicted transcriptional regulator
MDQSCIRHQSFPIRLGPSMQQQAAEIARRSGVSLNYFISQAIDEKVARLESPAALPGGAPGESAAVL